MLGNVREWVLDNYSPRLYSEVPDGGWVNPETTNIASLYVIRGGSWLFDEPQNFRVSFRGKHDESKPDSAIGFRCVK